jgi:hypothetical protein
MNRLRQIKMLQNENKNKSKQAKENEARNDGN